MDMDNKPTQKRTMLIHRDVKSGDINFAKSDLSKNHGGLATKLFLNIVSILGMARTGKSTLLNCVVGKDVFETSDSMAGCTKGVWLSNIVEEIDENGAILFVDTEGGGNDSVKNDITMLTPVVVLSKVIIFNVSSPILVQNLLDRLALFCHIADRIRLQDRAFQFGHLIIVVRKYYLKGTEEQAYDYYFGKEDGETDSVKKRNKIREKVLSMFQGITVRLFPDAFKMWGTPGNDAEINEDFTKRVNELQQEIRENVREPHKFGGETCLKLDNISEFIEAILNTLKEKQVVGLEAIVNLLQRKEVDNASSEFEVQLRQRFGEVVLPASNLEGTLVEIKDKLITEFEEKTSKVDFEKEYRNEVKNKLSEEFFVNLMNAKKAENTQLQRDNIDRARVEFDRKLATKLRSIVLPVRLEEIDDMLIEIRAELEDEFDKSTMDMDSALDYRNEILQQLNESCNKEFDWKKKENKPLALRIARARRNYETNLTQNFQKVSLPDARATIERKLNDEINKARARFEEDTDFIDGNSEYKKQILNRLKLFSDELKCKKMKENARRQEERKIVDTAKSTFKRSLKEQFQNIDLPMTDDEEPSEIIERQLERFDEKTISVDIESKYKNDVKNELSVFCKTERVQLSRRNKKANGVFRRFRKELTVGGCLMAMGIGVAVLVII